MVGYEVHMPKESDIGHVRIYDPKLNSDLGRLAAYNRRTKQSEGLLAIEAHLAANREALKKAPRLNAKSSNSRP